MDITPKVGSKRVGSSVTVHTTTHRMFKKMKKLTKVPIADLIDKAGKLLENQVKAGITI